MKTAFKLLLLLGLIVYLVFAFTDFTQRGDSSTCTGVDIAVADSNHAGFITPAEAERILRKAGLHPEGKRLRDVSSQKIEAELTKNPFIKEAVCYKTPGNRVHVLVTQRLPLLRVIARNGEDYYIDERGYVMEPLGYVADLAVATGHIDKAFARKELTKIGLFLRSNDFWNDQVEQIDVDENRRIDLIPRIGDQTIHLGTTDSITKKFRNLMAFYEKVLPEVGWNKYKRIDIAHANQIVCVKREKAH